MVWRWPEDQPPDRVALRFGASRITYGALARHAERVAAGLAASGIARGDRVAFLGHNDPAQIVLLFACARLGAILLPLNWRLAAPELRFILEDAGARLLCATPALREAALAAAPQGCRVVPMPDAEGAPAPRCKEDDPVLLVYTSGTTGTPKGAVLDQRALAANAAHASEVFDLTRDDRVLTVLPLFHVGGLNIQTLPALRLGAEVLLHPRFEPDAFFDAVERERPTLSLLVPAVMQPLVAHRRWAGADLSALRAVGAGSSDIPLPLIEAFHAKRIPVQQVYGATETAPIAIAQTRAEALAAPGSIGRPVGAVEARLDPATGEIAIRGPNVMRGYWNRAEGLTADGWFATGDVGRLDPEGRWWFTDRLKHVIISGGENIYPAEVERVLAGAPGVAEGAVIGRPDARWGEVPVAVVVPSQGFDAAAVLAHFEGRLARFKHPRDVVVVEALPRTALGKVAIGTLRAMVRG